MRLRYTTPAARDLDQLLDYLYQRSEQGARSVRASIEATLSVLVQYPLAGRLTNRPIIRRIAVSSYPYVIFYRASKDEIIIHAVRHAARRPAFLPSGA
ncbi:type II toxin-antitoxin system RelE/ParE family toxin [Labrys wisconsinensis]|uniref:Plasmid stabilization system protein ParE n=1 Tax=Labrys wisconsinensis TaxID=425677 RepID=A0ABU0JIQ4_9HYPH|nr:type II toxin-antitoxin system RelE/ParE family toxin [Labrys wisconsinensis]MDQ0474161.1 plasmid stabilization system protein ParE [Labrys wisconsinensis]